MLLGRLFLMMMVLLGLQSCKGSDKPASSPAASLPPSASTAPTRPRIALVMKTLTNPFYIEMEKGARRAAVEFNVDLIVKTGSQETAIEQQIQIVDELINSKIEALVIAPGDSQRLVPILKKAQDAGIAIIDIDNQLDPEVVKSQQMKPVPFISVNNEASSYLAAKYAAEKAKKPAKAAIIEGITSTANANLRMAGAERAFAEVKGIRVVAKETANWKIDEAHDVAKHMFAQNPDISILFCANDMMALGVIKYLQDSGRKGVLVAGYDALDEAKAAISSGAMIATIDQQAAEQGYQGVALAVKALKGEKLPLVTMIDAHLVTADTLK